MLEIVAFQLFDGITQSIGDLSFVITLMAFVYIVFWLYQTFAENQLIFLGTVVFAAFVMLFYPLAEIGLCIMLVFLNPMMVQNIVFGPGMLLQPGFLGGGMNPAEAEARMRSVQEKLQAGQPVDPQEMAEVQQMQAESVQGQYGGGMTPFGPRPGMFMRR
jgi:hypothetical protein